MRLDLMDFIEANILPRYNAFGPSHGPAHAMRVVRASLALAKVCGADEDMAYTVAAYHDLGLEGPRAVHHIAGGRILQNDRRLLRWFTPQQIEIMRQAVEDHRASASHAPRSIYGKIVAEADRDLDGDTVFRRAIEYGRERYPELTREQHWQRFQKHIENKYSAAHGYIKLWIPGSDNERKLQRIRQTIADEAALRKVFDTIYGE